VDRGWSVLIFPEGTRTPDGRMGPFRTGIGLLAAQLGVPVVPAYLGGIFALKQAGKRWARSGQITVSLGPPVRFGAARAAEDIARELERRVAALELSK
jgi:long-chain acyl-CoA synthetase